MQAKVRQGNHTHLEKVLSALVQADSSPLASGIMKTVSAEGSRKVKFSVEAGSVLIEAVQLWSFQLDIKVRYVLSLVTWCPFL